MWYKRSKHARETAESLTLQANHDPLHESKTIIIMHIVNLQALQLPRMTTGAAPFLAVYFLLTKVFLAHPTKFETHFPSFSWVPVRHLTQYLSTWKPSMSNLLLQSLAVDFPLTPTGEAAGFLTGTTTAAAKSTIPVSVVALMLADNKIFNKKRRHVQNSVC